MTNDVFTDLLILIWTLITLAKVEALEFYFSPVVFDVIFVCAVNISTMPFLYKVYFTERTIISHKYCLNVQFSFYRTIL